ncbi:MAG: riboflavin synthase [bacterium]|nr:riboflavin synthase [bacterium]
MFSGIINEIGTIQAITKRQRAWVVDVKAKRILSRLKKSGSVAVNGACLTVVKKSAGLFRVEVIRETLSKTTFRSLSVDDKVNLEAAVRPFDELGGHLVQGHIDATGSIMDIFDTGHDIILTVELPKRLMKYVADKGFIALDGVSLTGLNPDTTKFQVAIIPFTLEHTILKHKKVGDRVNIEVDMMAKYLERHLPRKK